MMRKGTALYNRPIRALDGELGKVHEFYFDDRLWQIRYLVVELGTWIKSRRVLISPLALAAFDGDQLTVQLTKSDIGNCPESETDKPVSLQQSERAETLFAMSQPFGGLGGGGASALPLVARHTLGDPERGTRWNRHLRSSRAVARYVLLADEGECGGIENFLIDDRTWTIRFLVIKPSLRRNPALRLLGTAMVSGIRWEQESVDIGCSRADVEKLPCFDPALHVNVSYEDFLDHYESLAKGPSS